MSLPTRGAWIEIKCPCRPEYTQTSLPTRGAWIEIGTVAAGLTVKASVAPHAGSVDRNSGHFICLQTIYVAPLAGSVDRNISSQSSLVYLCMSLPTRGAWIEISRSQRDFDEYGVAPHAGSVDRNYGVINPKRLRVFGRSPRGERG